ncbi:MAG: PspA/IM30 family protein [Phormidesmis sp. RL_2_1]|nr:PspA/IM30 family protein [Phormidesmis sp. RL_2_1]
MGLLDRFSRLVRANVNSFVNGAEDPEKALHQAVTDMQNDLVSMRQAVAQAIATQKRTERQSQQASNAITEWYNRAQLALQKGDEAMARDALARSVGYQQNAQSLEAQSLQQRDIVEKLKVNMLALQSKLAEARIQKDMYIARARAAQSSVRLHEMMSTADAQGTMNAFEKMESRVLDLEAQAEIARELSIDPLAQRFAQLENQNTVDTQLARMKAHINQPRLEEE